MDILQEIARETLRFCIGLYGFCVVAFVANVVYEVIERLVNWLGNKISANRKTKSLR
jgi:hypothetical protein